MYEDLLEQIEKAILAKVSVTLGINSVEEINVLPSFYNHFLLED